MNYLNDRIIIKEAWNNFFAQNKQKVSGINSLILESWIRCRDKGVDCFNQHIEVNDKELRKKSIEKNSFLIDISRPYMNDLYKTIGKSNFSITLVDKDGYVIDSINNPIVTKISRFKIMNLREDRVGTNAMGTCLHLDMPIQTWGEEHYYEGFHDFTTSAAPIHDSKGNLIGCIGITGSATYVSLHTIGMAIAIAYAIENKIKAIEEKEKSIFKSYDNIINQSISDGLIILDNEYKIVSLNKTIENILSIKQEETMGVNIKDIVYNYEELRMYLDKDINFTNKKAKFKIENKLINCNISLSRIESGLEKIGFIIIVNKQEDTQDEPINIITNKLYSFNDIVGDSDAIMESINFAKIASEGNSNVLIIGESGTGKELFAQSIHNNGPRKSKPFIDINCGALPLSLAESELFGYEGGSYTGAKKEGKAGKFEMADGGTIFLDEIGELPLSLQAALLRVIQERKVTRIGGLDSKDIDVMIVAATNRDLFKAVQGNTFRRDLFYRLNVFNINLPPLRERKSDIPIMVDSFIQKYNKSSNTYIQGITDDVLDIFKKYNWPGNVREIENIIERAVQIAQNEKIEVRDLPLYLRLSIDKNTNSKKKISLIETQEYTSIINVLRETKGNAKLAANILGIGRATIYRKLSRYDIDINEYRIK